MNFRSTFAKSALAGVAGVMALTAAAGAPSFAAAQPAGYYGGGYAYDPCRRENTNRGTVGALLGGALGAAIGSNAAARNARTEGALLGGALGAVGGAVVGKNSAACGPTGYRTTPPPPPQVSYNGYYGEPRNDYYQRSYDERPYYQPEPSYRVVERPAAATDGCTLAESPIYLPDGRTQKRFVRVCPDANGNYQVVD
jgi:hypothetical protein